jgi:CheY-like chemotaxis protein
MKQKIRILIADDHKLMRMGLVSLFNVQKDMTVVGEAEDGEQAIRMASELRPDIVIMDLMMPKVNGADATAAILAENPKLALSCCPRFQTHSTWLMPSQTVREAHRQRNLRPKTLSPQYVQSHPEAPPSRRKSSNR